MLKTQLFCLKSSPFLATIVILKEMAIGKKIALMEICPIWSPFVLQNGCKFKI
jgi:hypothetical protein